MGRLRIFAAVVFTQLRLISRTQSCMRESFTVSHFLLLKRKTSLGFRDHSPLREQRFVTFKNPTLPSV